MFIGLVLVNGENDVLAATLKTHERILDVFYALDGTVPAHTSYAIIRGSEKCVAYFTDAELPRPPYTPDARDGYRQFLLEQAVADHGPENVFLLLHGDEIWQTHPSRILEEHPDADGFGFRLPCLIPRERDGWDDTAHPFDQLRWMLGPGWPEFRMFRGNPDVRFDPEQHFNVTPSGLRNTVMTGHTILHFPYRSPQSQAARAAVTFDPDNYRETGLWDDDRIARARCHPYFEQLTEVTLGASADPV